MKENIVVEEIAFGNLLIKFENTQIEFILDRLLGYFDLPYMYFHWGYREYTEDIDIYINQYPQLKGEHGMIQIKDDDKKNTKLISLILNEYQISALYVNKYPNLVEDFNKSYKSRKWIIGNKYGGYIIEKCEDNTIIVSKDSSLPDWNLQKLGINT